MKCLQSKFWILELALNHRKYPLDTKIKDIKKLSKNVELGIFWLCRKQPLIKMLLIHVIVSVIV